MSDRQPKTASRRVRAALRRQQAVQMRLAGASYQQIADKLECTPSAAYKMVAKAMRDADNKTGEAAEMLRGLELARLDALMLAAWKQAVSGHLGAIDRVLRIMDRRARYVGLDAPSRLDVTSAGEKLASLDLSQLSVEQLYRIAQGEPIETVLADAEPEAEAGTKV